PEGGALEIETRNVDVDEDEAAANSEAVAGKDGLMTNTDTGVGMDEKTPQNAFEPFFTTQEPGQRTRVGVAAVRGIVRQSGGWIQVRSKPDEGTAFEIYLPRMDAPATAERTAAPAGETGRGAETLLVVEDDEAVRALTSSILAGQGYRVLEAANGDE